MIKRHQTVGAHRSTSPLPPPRKDSASTPTASARITTAIINPGSPTKPSSTLDSLLLNRRKTAPPRAPTAPSRRSAPTSAAAAVAAAVAAATAASGSNTYQTRADVQRSGWTENGQLDDPVSQPTMKRIGLKLKQRYLLPDDLDRAHAYSGYATVCHKPLLGNAPPSKWKRRWIVVKDNKVYFMRKPKENVAVFFITLDDCVIDPQAFPLHPHSFRLLPPPGCIKETCQEMMWIVVADSEDRKMDFMEAFLRAAGWKERQLAASGSVPRITLIPAPDPGEEEEERQRVAAAAAAAAKKRSSRRRRSGDGEEDVATGARLLLSTAGGAAPDMVASPLSITAPTPLPLSPTLSSCSFSTTSSTTAEESTDAASAFLPSPLFSPVDAEPSPAATTPATVTADEAFPSPPDSPPLWIAAAAAAEPVRSASSATTSTISTSVSTDDDARRGLPVHGVGHHHAPHRSASLPTMVGGANSGRHTPSAPSSAASSPTFSTVSSLSLASSTGGATLVGAPGAAVVAAAQAPVAAAVPALLARKSSTSTVASWDDDDEESDSDDGFVEDAAEAARRRRRSPSPSQMSTLSSSGSSSLGYAAGAAHGASSSSLPAPVHLYPMPLPPPDLRRSEQALLEALIAPNARFFRKGPSVTLGRRVVPVERHPLAKPAAVAAGSVMVPRSPESLYEEGRPRRRSTDPVRRMTAPVPTATAKVGRMSSSPPPAPGRVVEEEEEEESGEEEGTGGVMFLLEEGRARMSTGSLASDEEVVVRKEVKGRVAAVVGAAPVRRSSMPI
ncbi:hypothetical protein HDU96_010983 [Phlyctochytrium bullatum]|nr:hypothetical protein HDU96_010983 [Phlyctochytrium bullatum]